MEWVVGLVVVLGIAVLIGVCCKCCRSNQKGRVLQPPPAAAPGAPPAPYPQQQYSTVSVPAGTVVHNITPYPTPYPAASPYPAAAPYPTAAPYPASSPYPAAYTAPYPTSEPSAPNAHVLPPSYEQATGDKQPPYNPHMH